MAENGLVGLGEASPLPEFSGGTRDEVISFLVGVAPSLPGLPLRAALGRLGPTLGCPPALSFGLETAILDILSREAGKPLGEWLADRPVAPSVPVNATIGNPDSRAAARQAAKAVAEGFEVIKLKVGMALDLAGEVERVGLIREAIGEGVHLRIDANGAWPSQKAIQVLKELEQFKLELVEQPVPAHDLAALRKVRQAVSMPVAADEAVTSLEAARKIIEAGAADILVIKPMVVGGLRESLKIMELAARAGLKTFVTTTIDSGIGIAAALQLAVTLPNPPMACGLATAGLLEESLVKELPRINRGQMFLPTSPGLGVVLRWEYNFRGG